MSWETLTRVITTQLIVRALSQIRDAITEAYKSAVQFAKQINEIGAINPERSLGEIAADIRAMSDSFNQPLSRVAEAQYQTISDQFVTTAQRTHILTAANMLSKTSNQDLADSAMLLTGALNAYGESSDMAGVRAAQFFETVKLGRLRMGELGVAMGRVQALAFEVGISMEELEAAFISLTIGGVKPAEAATQLRGVMTGLLKPSRDMQKALESLGVASGEEAIATWNLEGTLERLWLIADKSASGMSKLFRNIRGDVGAMRLAGEGAQKFAEGLEAVNKIDVTMLRDKFEAVMGTDVEKLTKTLNAITNFFTVELGTSLISSLQTLASVFGGPTGLVGIMRAVTNQIVPTALSLGTLGAALLGISLYARAAASGIGGMTMAIAVLAALPILKGAGEVIGSKIGSWMTGPTIAAGEELVKNLARREELASAEIRVEERKNKALVQTLRQYVAEASKSYLQDAANFKESVKIEEKAVELAFNRIMQARQKMTQELFAASEAAAKKSIESDQQVAVIQQKIVDRETKTRIQLFKDAGQQAAMYANEAKRLGEVAARLQGTAKDSGEERLADAAWKRADAYATLAEQAAKQSGNTTAQWQAEQMLLALDNMRISASRRQVGVQQEVSKETEARAIEAERNNSDLEKRRLAIEAKLKTTVKDAGGGVTFKSRDQLIADILAADKLITEFKLKLKQYGKADFAVNFMGDPKAFEALKRELERSLASADLQTITVAPRAIADLYQTLQKSLDALKLKCPVLVEIEDVTGMSLLSDGFKAVLDAFEQRLSAIVKRSAEIPKNIASQMDIDTAYLKGREPAVKLAGDISMQTVHSRMDTPKINAARLGMLGLLSQLDAVRAKSDITAEDLTGLDKLVEGIDWSKFSWHQLPGTEAKMKAYLALMVDALIAQKKLQEEQKKSQGQLKVIPGEQEKINSINRQIEAQKRQKAEAAAAADPLKQGADAAKATKAALSTMPDLSGLAGQIQGAASAMWDLAYASMSVQSPSTEMMAAQGGKVWNFLALGGSPRGTDVIPAMLSPGEVVINAESARRFSAQVTAMNAGMQPVFRSDGGSVTNVGDINVSVTGGGSSRQTARSIASELRRELRRGTSTL